MNKFLLALLLLTSVGGFLLGVYCFYAGDKQDACYYLLIGLSGAVQRFIMKWENAQEGKQNKIP